MQKAPLDQSQLERPYTFFLFKSIAGIHESWINGDVRLALSEACKLVVFLPNDIKKALWSDRKQILHDLRWASGRTGSNFFTTQVVRNQQAKKVAYHYIEPFMDKMMRLLDAKGWLERGAMKPRYPTAKKLSVETIETR